MFMSFKLCYMGNFDWHENKFIFENLPTQYHPTDIQKGEQIEIIGDGRQRD